MTAVIRLRDLAWRLPQWVWGSRFLQFFTALLIGAILGRL